MRKLSRGVKKYIRKEKARIRREILDLEKQKELIKQLYHKFGIKLGKNKKIKNFS